MKKSVAGKRSLIKTLFSVLVYKNKNAIYEQEAEVAKLRTKNAVLDRNNEHLWDEKMKLWQEMATLDYEIQSSYTLLHDLTMKNEMEKAEYEKNIVELAKNYQDAQDRYNKEKVTSEQLAERVADWENEFLDSGRATATSEINRDEILAQAMTASYLPEDFMEVPHGAELRDWERGRSAKLLLAGNMPKELVGAGGFMNKDVNFNLASGEDFPVVMPARGFDMVSDYVYNANGTGRLVYQFSDGKRFFIARAAKSKVENPAEKVCSTVKFIAGKPVDKYDKPLLDMKKYTFADEAMAKKLEAIAQDKMVNLASILVKTDACEKGGRQG
ncbi:MAG: hypothetical protein LBL52_01125 [Rickettsiales bacterium]|jgi:hypothetical protein|nr:hypothetical protein [Rickettsiales bacterium]